MLRRSTEWKERQLVKEEAEAEWLKEERLSAKEANRLAAKAEEEARSEVE